MTRKLMGLLICVVLLTLGCSEVSAASVGGEDDPDDSNAGSGPPSVEVDVTQEDSRPGGGTGGTGGGGGSVPLSPEWQAYVDCVAAGGTCISPPYRPGEPVPVFDPLVVARRAVDSVPLRLPGPHTSPPEGGFQLVGVPTWFWLDPEGWGPVSARAELPGVWAEVTATPVSAAWGPGDGSGVVVCDGPGRPYPGGAGVRPECGHTYDAVGSFTVTVEVTWEVTWTSSTGAGGSLDPIVVDAQLPLDVQERQAVTD